jgi:hypothetical protein
MSGRHDDGSTTELGARRPIKELNMKTCLARVPVQYGILVGTAALAILAGCAGAGSGPAGSNVPQGASRDGSMAQSVTHQSPIVDIRSVLPPGMQKAHLPPGIAPPVSGLSHQRACPDKPLAFISDGALNVVYEADNVSTCGPALQGFNEPQGLAVDQNKNLWVANTAASNVLEYAPPYNGAPVAILNDPGEYPVDVCVDPNNNVAVTNVLTVAGGPGNIVLYAAGAVNATGMASNANFPSPRFCAFASNGNLAFDDLNANGATNLGLVLKGNIGKMNAAIKTLTFTNQIAFPGGVQVPTHGGLAVLDQTGLVIDRYKNPKDLNLGAPISVTHLAGAGDPVQFQFWPFSRVALAADAANDQTEAYRFPAGGSPFYVYPFNNGGQPIGVGHQPSEQFSRPRSQSVDASALP